MYTFQELDSMIGKGLYVRKLPRYAHTTVDRTSDVSIDVRYRDTEFLTLYADGSAELVCWSIHRRAMVMRRMNQFMPPGISARVVDRKDGLWVVTPAGDIHLARPFGGRLVYPAWVLLPPDGQTPPRFLDRDPVQLHCWLVFSGACREIDAFIGLDARAALDKASAYDVQWAASHLLPIQTYMTMLSYARTGPSLDSLKEWFVQALDKEEVSPYAV